MPKTPCCKKSAGAPITVSAPNHVENIVELHSSKDRLRPARQKSVLVLINLVEYIPSKIERLIYKVTNTAILLILYNDSSKWIKNHQLVGQINWLLDHNHYK